MASANGAGADSQPADTSQSIRLFWSKDAVVKLVELFIDSECTLTGKRGDSKIFNDLAAQLTKAGFPCTGKQVNQKFNNLKSEHKKVCDKVNTTGQPKLTEQERYIKDVMDPIFGDRGSAQPVATVQSLPTDKEQDSEPEETISDDEEKPVNLTDEPEDKKDIKKKIKAKSGRPPKKRRLDLDVMSVAETVMASYKEIESEKSQQELKKIKMEQDAMIALEKERGKQQMEMLRFMSSMIGMQGARFPTPPQQPIYPGIPFAGPPASTAGYAPAQYGTAPPGPGPTPPHGGFYGGGGPFGGPPTAYPTSYSADTPPSGPSTPRGPPDWPHQENTVFIATQQRWVF